ncbi:MAG: restriction endonuclease subunit S, partial [Spirochaetaceae bacterium]|nr:restriction endonuclease subunit S [Spirochaetaceae bacterium]
ASAYIYKAFANDYDFPIHDSLKDNISRIRLVDMLTFDRANFEKNISTAVQKKVRIESKWGIVRLGSRTKINYGIRIVKRTEQGTIYPVYGGGGETFKANSFNRKNVYIISRFGRSPECVRFVAGEFFLNDSGMSLETLDNDVLNQKYLDYFLLLNQDIVYQCGRGVAQKNIDIEAFYNIQIPLPPLPVQQKIVSEIEALEKKEAVAKEKIENSVKRINDILETSSIEQHKISDIIALEYGAALPESSRIKGEFPVMGSNGIVGRHNAYLTEGPSIIVGRKGSAGKITWSNVNCFPIDTTFYVKLIDNRHNLKLIYYALQKADLESLSGGTGVPGLNRNAVYTKGIPLPPLQEQQKIVSEIEKLEIKIQELQNQLEQFPLQKEQILRKYL